MRSQACCSKNILPTGGPKTDITAPAFGVTKMFKEPTNILNSFGSCIDRIFTCEHNSVIHSGVDPSLLPNCHHQIVFANFYSPPIWKLVWHYKHANTDLTTRSMEYFGWEKAFSNLDINRFQLLTTQLCISSKSLFRTKQLLLMTKIPVYK